MVLFKNKLSFTGFAGLFANILKTGAAISVCTLLSCSGDSSSGSPVDEQNSDDVSVAETEITGVTQKGPFLMGSKVQMFEISNGRSLNQTGKSFNGKISNDKGEFKINGSKLVSQYVILEASGYYRNENTGKNSNSELTLLAISDVKDRNTININLLTHLEYERVNYLVTEKNVKVDDAKKQAQKEILEIFDIDNKNFSNSEDLNIAGASDEDGALLAISILLQGDRSESQLSELLTKIAIDMEEDGEWNDDSKRNEIADWAAEIVQSGRIESIRENIEKWKLSNVVPNFEKYINNFWWNNYGFAACDKDYNGKILQNANKQSEKYQIYYICKDGLWKEASALEFDTYQWASGKDGDDKYGSVNSKNCYVFEDKVWRSGNASDCSLGLRGCTALRQDTVGKGSDKIYHICDEKSWRNATTYEKDTFGWKDSTDGAIKKGNVTDSIYVFDKNVWRTTSNVEAKLGGCVTAIADSVGKVGSTYYICKSNKWVEAAAIEYDSYRWTAGKDGDSKYGSVNTKNCYVYENKEWRNGNTSDCSLGLRGCTVLRQDTVGKGSDKVWHICDSKSWRNATTYEKDTFGWKDSTDGAIKKGNVTDSIYVFEKNVWRTTSNVEAKLGGCVTAIADSVGKVGSTYYICKSNKWVEASAIEYDTYRWMAGNDGEVRAGLVNKDVYYIYEKSKKNWRNATTIEKDTYEWSADENNALKKGNVTDSLYVYDGGEYRLANAREISLNLGCTIYSETGTIAKNDTSDYICEKQKWVVQTKEMVDSRDGSVYTTVRIGKQMWMAENLKYSSSNPKNIEITPPSCYYEGADNIYTWHKAMNISSELQNVMYGKSSIQGICPLNWHVPSKEEYEKLIEFVGGPTKAWFSLKEWGNDEYEEKFPPNEKLNDIYGFNADNNYGSGGGMWWTSSEIDENNAITFYLSMNYFERGNLFNSPFSYATHKRQCGHPVRCVKDDE